MPKYTAEKHKGLIKRVLLDGIPQRLVIEADTDEGYVVKYVEAGDDILCHTLVLPDGVKKIPKAITLRGKVEIELEDTCTNTMSVSTI